MKKHAAKILFILLFLSGLSLLLYPFVSNEWNNYRQKRLISGYDEVVATRTLAGDIDYDQEWERARNYNEALKPYVLPDSFANAQHSEEADEEYMSCLNLTGEGMMGYVEIPKIDVKIPIFHTVDEEVLQTAAGHLEGSSLPVGGEGSHAVISAHRGLPSAALFTDLDRLEEGDSFLLYILDDVLCYQVDQVSIVEPEDTGGLAAQAGEDLVTLLTCTPYGINSQRLLVRGHRIPYEDARKDLEAGAAGPSLHTNYLLWVILGLSVTGVFILILYLLEKRSRKKRAGEEKEEAKTPEEESREEPEVSEERQEP